MLRLQLNCGMKHKHRFQIECEYFKPGSAQKNQSKEWVIDLHIFVFVLVPSSHLPFLTYVYIDVSSVEVVALYSY